MKRSMRIIALRSYGLTILVLVKTKVKIKIT